MLVNEESNVLSLMHLMSNFAFVFLQKLDDEGPRIIIVIRVLIEIWRYGGMESILLYLGG